MCVYECVCTPTFLVERDGDFCFSCVFTPFCGRGEACLMGQRLESTGRCLLSPQVLGKCFLLWSYVPMGASWPQWTSSLSWLRGELDVGSSGHSASMDKPSCDALEVGGSMVPLFAGAWALSQHQSSSCFGSQWLVLSRWRERGELKAWQTLQGQNILFRNCYWINMEG